MGRHDQILKSLQALSERDLTEQVLVPLFGALGYQRVEYSGGPTEQGKDLTCWKRDEIGDVELTVVQVKRFKTLRPAHLSRSLQTVLNQLSQACEKPLPSSETRQLHLPAIAYFVTPFPVDTLVLQSKFEALATLRHCRIKIIDGHRLGNLLEQRLPPLVARLLGHTRLFADVVTKHLTNDVLRRALDLPAVRHVETFYTDIGLAPGQFAAQVLFQAHFEPLSARYRIDPRGWQQLRAARDCALQAYDVDVTPDDLIAIEEAFDRLVATHDIWSAKHSILVDNYEEAVRIEADCQRRQDEAIAALRRADHPALHEFTDDKALLEAVRELMSLDLGETKPGAGASPDDLAHRSQARRSVIDTLRRRLAVADKSLAPPLHDLDAATQAAAACRLAVAKSSDAEPALFYEVRLDGSALASSLTLTRARLAAEIDALNKTQPSLEQLRGFLLEFNHELRRLQSILQVTEILRSLGPRLASPGASAQVPSALSAGIQRVLDTGVNLLVLGEAGAGKTTSLQMYAYRKLAADSSRNLVLYVPIAKAARLVLNPSRKDLDLLEVIAAFFTLHGADISRDDLERQLLGGGVVLIDGIDEVADAVPDLLPALARLATQLPGVQWVVSARTSGQLSLDLHFTPVTLLPFSAAQRHDFVVKWFGGARRDAAEDVLDHLRDNCDVAEIVRNPLLMTILCVLADNGLPLPNSEVRLYKDRFDLLLGRYDLYKEIIRLRTRADHLMTLAQRIAYGLHQQRAREADRATLEAWSLKVLESDLGRAGSARALGELVDPCNVLMPMSPDGKLGFGHLRYQEYLAARELIENRSVPVPEFVGVEWWSGVLLLFARMSPNIGWLVEQVHWRFRGNPPPILHQMVEAGAARERDGLRWFLRNRASSVDHASPPD